MEDLKELIKISEKDIEKVDNIANEIKIIARVKWDNGVEVVTQSAKRKRVSELDKTFWDGYSLNEIKIGVTFHSKSEIEHLIEFLQIHKFCLKK